MQQGVCYHQCVLAKLLLAFALLHLKLPRPNLSVTPSMYRILKPGSFSISRGIEATPAASPSDDTSVLSWRAPECRCCTQLQSSCLVTGKSQKEALPRKGPESQARAAATHLQGDTG